MSSLLKISHIFLFITFVLILACDNYPIFTEIKTSRLQIKLKGTYESNNPKNWEVFTDSLDTRLQDDSVIHHPYATQELFPTLFMIDIAEIRLKGKELSKFSLIRQAKTIPLTDDEAFFNGNGINLDGNDPNPDHTFKTVYFYIRKVLFNQAMYYMRTETGWDEGTLFQDVFEEDDVYGFNFNSLQLKSNYQNILEEGNRINNIFPLRIPIEGKMNLKVDDNNIIQPAVLEIRLVVKNFIKKYEYGYFNSDDGIFYIYHFYAFSDWLRDVKKNELGSDLANAMGGNLHAVARVYYPDEVGSISGANSSGMDGYVIALNTGSDINTYLTPSLSTARDDNPCDFPAAPSVVSYYQHDLIDYYLNVEQYKYNYNQKLQTCVDENNEPSQITFQHAWEAYEQSVYPYRIPPLVTYTQASTSYTLENVMPGTYDVYFFPDPGYGQLIRNNTGVTEPYLTPIATVTVSTGNNTQIKKKK